MTAPAEVGITLASRGPALPVRLAAQFGAGVGVIGGGFVAGLGTALVACPRGGGLGPNACGLTVIGVAGGAAALLSPAAIWAVGDWLGGDGKLLPTYVGFLAPPAAAMLLGGALEAAGARAFSSPAFLVAICAAPLLGALVGYELSNRRDVSVSVGIAPRGLVLSGAF